MKTFTDQNLYVCKLDWGRISGTTLWLLIDDLVSKGRAEHRDWTLAVDELGVEFRFKNLITAYQFARKFNTI